MPNQCDKSTARLFQLIDVRKSYFSFYYNFFSHFQLLEENLLKAKQNKVALLESFYRIVIIGKEMNKNVMLVL